VIATLALFAMMMVGLVVVGTVAVVGLTAVGGTRLARHQADAQAALALWRRQVRLEAARAPSEALRAAQLGQLDDPPRPRVALAMRRLEAERYDVTSMSQQSGPWWNRVKL
jgi:hypothetical protein